jgi:hypothetical protein
VITKPASARHVVTIAVTAFFGEPLTRNGNLNCTRDRTGNNEDTELNRAEDTETSEKRRCRNYQLSRDLVSDAHSIPDRDGLLYPRHPEELAAR